jgi:hypothetical protein
VADSCQHGIEASNSTKFGKSLSRFLKKKFAPWSYAQEGKKKKAYLLYKHKLVPLAVITLTRQTEISSTVSNDSVVKPREANK